MTSALLLAVSPGEAWAARLDDDELIDLRLARSHQAGRVGELHLGRVLEIDPVLGAALVEIGLARPAFLSAEDTGGGLAGLHQGQALLVQVTKDARADKAAGITARPRLKGRFLDLLPGRPGLKFARGIAAAEQARLAASLGTYDTTSDGFELQPESSAAAAGELAADAQAVSARWQAVRAHAKKNPPARLETPAPTLIAALAELLSPPPDRIVIDDRTGFAEARAWLMRHHPTLLPRLAFHAGPEPLFEAEGVAAEIDTAFSPRVALPSGGALTIETSAAAVMIDVDSGGAPILATNLAAARAAARQIRLRSLGGPIIIDFITMKKRGERDQVGAVLTAALAGDPAGAQFLGWTRLGHAELVRQRRHPALDEMLYERGDGGRVKTALTVALEALRAAAREADRAPGRALVLALNAEVAACLAEGAAAEARAALEARLGRPLELKSEPNRPRAAFDIRTS